MLRIIYGKTNIYNQPSLLRMLGILSHFIDAILKKNLTSHFPYVYFMKHLRIVLEKLECSISISQTLALFYNFYDKFEKNFRYELSCYLLGSQFWRLFYHWSYNVRRAYFHLILLKVAQDG